MLLRCRSLLPLASARTSTIATFSTRRTVEVILMKDEKFERPLLHSLVCAHFILISSLFAFRHVGYQFDQVAVAPGHARNFLIPQRIAVYVPCDNPQHRLLHFE